MENQDFDALVAQWKDLNRQGRFTQARKLYFDRIFQRVIDRFVAENQDLHCDILLSLLGNTPEPIILASRALNPKRHIIIHDPQVAANADNQLWLPHFLPEGYDDIELPDIRFGTLYPTLMEQSSAGGSITVNITGGKKSMSSIAAIFARDAGASVCYVDFAQYDPDIRRPIPGTETLDWVYSPRRDTTAH